MSQVLNFKKITKHMLKNITLSQLKILMIKTIGKEVASGRSPPLVACDIDIEAIAFRIVWLGNGEVFGTRREVPFANVGSLVSIFP